jgi:hypothetical protein
VTEATGATVVAADPADPTRNSAGFWILRRGSDAVLRLTAGLVAIFATDKRSHADRALEIVRLLRNTDCREASHRADLEPDDRMQQQGAATVPAVNDLLRSTKTSDLR